MRAYVSFVYACGPLLSYIHACVAFVRCVRAPPLATSFISKSCVRRTLFDTLCAVPHLVSDFKINEASSFYNQYVKSTDYKDVR